MQAVDILQEEQTRGSSKTSDGTRAVVEFHFYGCLIWIGVAVAPVISP